MVSVTAIHFRDQLLPLQFSIIFQDSSNCYLFCSQKPKLQQKIINKNSFKNLNLQIPKMHYKSTYLKLCLPQLPIYYT